MAGAKQKEDKLRRNSSLGCGELYESVRCLVPVGKDAKGIKNTTNAKVSADKVCPKIRKLPAIKKSAKVLPGKTNPSPQLFVKQPLFPLRNSKNSAKLTKTQSSRSTPSQHKPPRGVKPAQKQQEPRHHKKRSKEPALGLSPRRQKPREQKPVTIASDDDPLTRDGGTGGTTDGLLQFNTVVSENDEKRTERKSTKRSNRKNQHHHGHHDRTETTSPDQDTHRRLTKQETETSVSLVSNADDRHTGRKIHDIRKSLIFWKEKSSNTVFWRTTTVSCLWILLAVISAIVLFSFYSSEVKAFVSIVDEQTLDEKVTDYEKQVTRT